LFRLEDRKTAAGERYRTGKDAPWPHGLRSWLLRPRVRFRRWKSARQRAWLWERACAEAFKLDREVGAFRKKYLKAQREERLTPEMAGMWAMYVRFAKLYEKVQENGHGVDEREADTPSGAD
jgi:hypothetical protein